MEAAFQLTDWTQNANERRSRRPARLCARWAFILFGEHNDHVPCRSQQLQSACKTQSPPDASMQVTGVINSSILAWWLQSLDISFLISNKWLATWGHTVHKFQITVWRNRLKSALHTEERFKAACREHVCRKDRTSTQGTQHERILMLMPLITIHLAHLFHRDGKCWFHTEAEALEQTKSAQVSHRLPQLSARLIP